MSAAAVAPAVTDVSSPLHPSNIINLALPKGRMMDGVLALLKGASIDLHIPDRGYRPTINLPNFSVKLLKPQNIITMLGDGSRDLGFGGADWVANLGFEDGKHIVELLDTGMDQVNVVAAGPNQAMIDDALVTGRHLRIASEYEKLTVDWIARMKLNASFVRAYGATESFPPEDADLIVDNTATGSTLKANGLSILDVVYTSSTRLYANAEALQNPIKAAAIEKFVVLIKSVLHARSKVNVTFNIDQLTLDRILPTLPCMRAPTAAALYHGKQQPYPQQQPQLQQQEQAQQEKQLQQQLLSQPR